MIYIRATFLAMLFVPAVASASFPDVAKNHPHAEAIEYIQSTKIVSGYPDGSYRPDQAINRAEFTKIIEGSIPEAENGVMVCNAIEPTDAFSDVKTQEWFWLYVCMAKGRNLIGGYPDGTFGPANPINIAEAAKILYNAKHVDDRGIVTEGAISEVPWYAPYMRYLRENDALPASILSNDQFITRGEMAEMIFRLSEARIGANAMLSSDASLQKVSIEKLLDRDAVPYKGKILTTFTTDRTGNHYAILMYDDATTSYQVYKDGIKLYDKSIEKKYGSQLVPVMFRFTDDGSRLLYAIEPTVLFMDAIRLSSIDNLYNYYTGTTSAAEKDGNIVFPETDRIVRYEPSTKTKNVIFSHANRTLEFVRIEGAHYYYVITDEAGLSSLYKNGNVVSVVPVDNPTNYLISHDGGVYYFSKPDASTYEIYRNDVRVFAGNGFGGFLYESPQKELYHVGYRVSEGKPIDIRLYRDGQKISTVALGNMEGFMGFSDDGKHFGTRSSKISNPLLFWLYKDGEWIGEPFAFEEKKDFTGVQFLGEKSYMRNFVQNRWKLYEDGIAVSGSLFRNVWFFRIDGEKVYVYGTEF